MRRDAAPPPLREPRRGPGLSLARSIEGSGLDRLGRPVERDRERQREKQN